MVISLKFAWMRMVVHSDIRCNEIWWDFMRFDEIWWDLVRFDDIQWGEQCIDDREGLVTQGKIVLYTTPQINPVGYSKNPTNGPIKL